MKKFILTIFFVFSASVCFAQHTDVFVIDDFSKMLQSHVSPYLLPKNAASEARNVRVNDKYGTLAKRPKLLDYGTAGSFPLTSLHRYYKSDGTDVLIVTGSTFIKIGNDDTGAFTTIKSGLTSGLRWSWVTYKDRAIGCNGTDRCQKYDGATQTTANTDGSRTAGLLTTDLGAPFAELNTGSNLDASSWYQYKVAFYNGTTYSYSTARSNPIQTGSTVRDISLTDIPLGPVGTTYRYIYRTLGNSTQANVESDTTFYLVGTLSDNSTTTFNDNVADDTADNNSAPTWSTVQGSNVTPPIVKFILLHNNRLFGANSPSYKSYVYWSNSFYYEIFDSTDYEYIRIDDGDEITFLLEQLGRVVIGKTNTISNFDTQNSDDTKWIVYTLSFVGCPAPYSPAMSPLGIFYLGWDGIYIYNGETSQLVSDVVTPEIRDILPANLDEVVGIYFQNKFMLTYTSEESGESINNTVLVLDTLRNAYILDDMNINCFEVFDSGSDYGTLYSGSSDNDGKVWAHDSSLSDLVYKFKSDLSAGTRDSVTLTGTETNPGMELGWGIYINDTSMSTVTLDSATYSSATLNRPKTTGYWWGPAVQVNASNYDKIYWNEALGNYGDVTFALRSAATSSAVTADSLAWSDEYSDPSGSDLSGLTANVYLQLRAKLTTTDIAYTPELERLNNYVIKLIYSKVGTSSETSILSQWESGFSDFGVPTLPKRIWGIDVYYTGTSGTMTVGLENGEGDINQSFDIDLSTDPSSATDQYFGTNDYKIYKWLAPVNSSANPTPIGRTWKFSVQEDGTDGWNIYKIVIKFSKEDYYDE